MVKWTPILDARLCALRGAGVTWDGIALDMRLGRNTVLERGRRLGARRLQALATPEPTETEHRDRPPRPPGHPQSWGLITQGTVLEGTPYPYPVFL